MIENQIVNKAIDYIFSKLEGNPSVEDIAEYCGYSKFYLNRLFKAEIGESIYSFVKRLKVEQSAWRLKVEQGKSITEIGNAFGYSASNYATLFREHFEKSPAQFRKDIGDISLQHSFAMGGEKELETFKECCNKVTIEVLPDFHVLYERRKGRYENLKEDWCRFMENNKEFVTDSTVFIERTVNDPTITKPEDCLYDICMTVDKDDPRLSFQKTAAAGITSRAGTPAGINTMVIEGGKFAVYHYKGYPQMIYQAYQSFFCNWLAKTGNEIDSRGGFDLYRYIDNETLYMELDICIPIV